MREVRAKVGTAIPSSDSHERAPVSASAEWAPQTLHALLAVIQDGSANLRARRKAALKVAEFLLPKSGRKENAIPDEYGFWVSPMLANAYRNIQLELRVLANDRAHNIPAMAKMIKILEARSQSIRRRLEMPCPTRYGYPEVTRDYLRLAEFTRLRENKIDLTESQKAEEAHVRIRYDLYTHSPESIARRRLKALQEADQRFRKWRLWRDFPAPPLSRKERYEANYLQSLFLGSGPKLEGKELEEYRDQHDQFINSSYHPFKDLWPDNDGYFYPLYAYEAFTADGEPLTAGGRVPWWREQPEAVSGETRDERPALTGMSRNR